LLGAASVVIIIVVVVASSVSERATNHRLTPLPLARSSSRRVASRHPRASRAPFPFALPFAFARVALVVVRHRAAIERDGTLVVVVVVVALAIARAARSIARRIVVRRPRAEMTKHPFRHIHSSSSLSDARDAFDVRAREGDDRGASDDRWRRSWEDARARRG
tara:strand:+ start:4771 stop:5259 length:489 start_codon:yes stop_codon:yes gene_type:complete